MDQLKMDSSSLSYGPISGVDGSATELYVSADVKTHKYAHIYFSVAVFIKKVSKPIFISCTFLIKFLPHAKVRQEN